MEYKTPAEALAAWSIDAEPCSGIVRRTQAVKVLNSSGCGIVIAFQRLDSRYVPAGYESTTGVYPTCNNLPPRTDCLVDPCRAQISQPVKPIAAEIANCTVKFKCGDREIDVNCPEEVAPAGKYFVTVVWSFSSALAEQGGAPSFSVEVSSETADLPKSA
jgi:hypothetical protein